VKRNLLKASQSFICRSCKIDRQVTDGLNIDMHLDFGNGVSLQKVDRFCYRYLRDILDADKRM